MPSVSPDPGVESAPLRRAVMVLLVPVIAAWLVGGCGPQRPSGDSAEPVALAVEPVRPTPSVSRNPQQDIRRRLMESPRDPQANADMIEWLIEQKDFDAAIELIDAMTSMDPEHAQRWQVQAAEVFAESGNLAASTSRWKALVRRYPLMDQARHQLADLMNRQGYPFDASEHLRSLLRHGPLEQEELVSLAFPIRSWKSAEQIDAMEPKAAGVMLKAGALRIAGRVREAIELLDRSIDEADADPARDALYGRLLADAQEIDRLRKWITTVSDDCRRYPDYWMASGVLAADARRFDLAQACFAQVILREPHHVEAHYRLIEALESAGITEKADLVRRRVEALDAISRDLLAIRKTPSPRAQSYAELAERLMIVGRPLEAIAWQEIALAKFSPRSPQRGQIKTYKKAVLREFPQGTDLAEITFGLASESETLLRERLLEQFPVEDLAPKITPQSPAPPASAGPKSAPRFVNVAGPRGLKFRYRNAPVPVEREFLIFQAFGGGVACLDYDRDGHVDFYFGQAGGSPPQELSRDSNGMFRGDGERFTNVIEAVGADDRGYTLGVTAGDWNQDGFADILVGNLGHNHLWINCGDGTFALADSPSLSDPSVFTSSVAIADVTSDGLPDLIEVNYLDDDGVFEPIQHDAQGKPVSLPGPLQFLPTDDRLLISTGDGSMRARPIGGESQSEPSTGLALLVTDWDGQPGNEVFVGNDLMANQLWKLDRSGDAKVPGSAAAVASGIAYGRYGKPTACMGIAAADFNGDQRVDLHVTNFENEWSNHYLQTGPGVFRDASVRHGIHKISHPMLGFGVQAFDYDNDTSWDLIVGNGHIEDLTEKGSRFAMPTQLLTPGADGYRVAEVGGDPEYWSGEHFSRAMAKCDFDRDGRVDIVVTDLKRDAVLLANQTDSTNHWLQLELVGRRSERDAVGATVTAHWGSVSQTQVVQTGDGYLSKNESVLFFSTGDAERIDRLEIRWPSGATGQWSDVATDVRMMIVEGDSAGWLLSR